MATGRMSRANNATGLATTTSACGNRWLAPTRPVCAPDVVTLAPMPTTASATIPKQDKTQRSKSAGLGQARSGREVCCLHQPDPVRSLTRLPIAADQLEGHD